VPAGRHQSEPPCTYTGREGNALQWVSAPWQRVDTDLSLQKGHVEKLRVGANSCAVSLAKGTYFRSTIELAFLFEYLGFRVRVLFMSHEMAVVGGGLAV